VAQEMLALQREIGATGVAVEQPEAKIELQLAQRLRDGRLRDTEDM
jgi:hypothetical protein